MRGRRQGTGFLVGKQRSTARNCHLPQRIVRTWIPPDCKEEMQSAVGLMEHCFPAISLCLG